MAGFTDSKGRRWQVRITPYTMRQVKDFAGINLGTILQDKMLPLANLLQDPADLCSVMYAICRDQANQEGVDLKDFMEGIVGDPIEDAAAALLEGLREVFPTTQRVALTAVIALTRKDQKRTNRQVTRFLKDLTFLNSASRWQRLWAWIRGILPLPN